MRPTIHPPLQLKIGILVGGAMLIVFALFGYLGWTLLHESVERAGHERLTIARMVASFLDTELEEQFEQLERGARLLGPTINGDLEPEALSDVLRHQEPFVSAVFLVDRFGRVRWSEPVGLRVLDPLPDPADFDDGGRYVSRIHRADPSGRLFVALAVRSHGADGLPNGVVGALLDVGHATFRGLVREARQLGKTGHAELVNKEGLVLASSESIPAGRPGEHEAFFRPLLAQGIASSAVTAPSGDEVVAQGQRHAMVFVPLRAVPWGLVLGGSESELLAEAEQWRWRMALFGALALVVAIGLVWVTIRSVSRTVLALTKASVRIGSGDLATPVPDLGAGEVHVLARALEEMRCHLREALDALAVEKSRYEGIVGSMADAVFSTDGQARITAFNRASELLSGRSAADVIGLSCDEVFRSQGVCEEEDCASACLGAPDVAWPSTFLVTKRFVKRQDGGALFIAHARSPIRDASDNPVGVLHVLRDISQEKEVERLRDEFLSMVSHELRTPLGHIKGYATTLLLPDGPADEETRERCLRVIVEASDELDELVRNLLDMSRIGAGAFRVDPQPTRLLPIVHAAVERARLRSKLHQVQVLAAARIPLVSADARRVEQVMSNLLDNALKYSPQAGIIRVGVATWRQEAVVSVADEGIGIPPDEMDGVFEPFRRGRGARARRIGGSGLGLAICKGIILAHQGRIWVESIAPGDGRGAPSGTTIRFTLPLATRQPDRGDAHVPDDAVESRSRPKAAWGAR